MFRSPITLIVIIYFFTSRIDKFIPALRIMNEKGHNPSVSGAVQSTPMESLNDELTPKIDKAHKEPKDNKNIVIKAFESLIDGLKSTKAKELQAKVSKLTKELEETQRELEDVTETSKRDSDLLKLESQFEKKSVMNEMDCEVKMKLKEIETLKEKLDNVTTSTQREMNELNEKLSGSRVEIDRYKGELETNAEKFVQYKISQVQMESEIKSKTEEIDKLKKELEDAIARLKRETDDLKQRLAVCMGEIDRYKNELFANASRMTEMDNIINSKSAKIDKLEEEMESERKLKVAEMKNLKLTQDNAKIEWNYAMDKLNNDIDLKTKDIENLQRDSDAKMTEMKNGIKLKDEEIEKIKTDSKSRISQLEKEVESKSEEIEKIKIDSDAKMTEMENGIKLKDEEIEKIKTDWKSRISQLEKEVESKSEEIEKIKIDSDAKMTEMENGIKLKDEEIEMTSEEDPRSKRGGHLLFDQSSFPDAVILEVRTNSFTISASFLALQSAYFYDIFYGSTGMNGRYALDVDPDVFGDLLDFIYPCYKKINCCVDCSSSLTNRLDLALHLKLRFAVKRLLKDVSPSEEIMAILQKHNAVATYSCFFDKKYSQVLNKLGVKQCESCSLDPLPVTTEFPDSTIVNVGRISMLVSATALSLHSSILNELLYKNGELVKGVKIDVDPNSFLTFVQAISGEVPTDYTVKFLDDLLILGAKGFYDYFMSEIRMKLMTLPSEEASRSAKQLLEHYGNQPNPDRESMKLVSGYLLIDQPKKSEEVLSKCSSLSRSVEERSRENSNNEFWVLLTDLKGGNHSVTLPRGVHTSVEELKKRYEEKTGHLVDHQRHIFDGKQLEDGKTLEFYKIVKGSKLHVVSRLSGC